MTSQVTADPLAQHGWLATQEVVEPVVLERDKEILVLDVQKLMPLKVTVEEEDGGIEPLVADLEAENADGFGVLVVLLDELEANLVVEQFGCLVPHVGMGQVGKGLLELSVLATAELSRLEQDRAGAHCQRAQVLEKLVFRRLRLHRVLPGQGGGSVGTGFVARPEDCSMIRRTQAV